MRIFLTGTRGTLGSEVVRRLTSQGHSLVGLVRSGSTITTNDGTSIAARSFDGRWPEPGAVAVVPGDIRLERLGMDDGSYGAVRSSAQMIVHSAALTSFGRPREHYQRHNVEGTRRILAMATGGSPPIALLHVSTMYVCGERPGTFCETDLEREQSFGSPYEESKYQAELEVRAAMKRGLPAVILRPSIIVGDSRTGMMRKFDTIYTVYRITSAGLVGTIPGDYGATLDIVPIDWVADGVVAAVREFARAQGKTLHLCSQRPLTLRDINDVCAEFPSFNVPRFVPGHVFRAYRSRGLEKRYYDEVISLYESYFRRQVAFLRTDSDQILPGPPLDGKQLLRLAFRHAVEVGYFRRRNHGV